MNIRQEIDQAILYALQFPPSWLPHERGSALTDWRITMIAAEHDDPHYRLFDEWGLSDDRALFVVQRTLKRLVRQGLVVFVGETPPVLRPRSLGLWRRLSLLEVLAYAAR